MLLAQEPHVHAGIQGQAGQGEANRPQEGQRPAQALETSVPGVFAAGDCTTVPYKQIIIAMGAGAIASLSAFDHLIRA